MFDRDESEGVLAADVAVDATALDFDRFFIDTNRRTLAVAFALTANWADAEDLTQEAYASAHRNWSLVGGYDDPASWVRRAVTNRSVSRWRRLTREVRAVARLAGRSRDGQHEPDTGDAQFWAAVRSLPARQRQVVALFYVDDLSVEQVAEQLGCAEGTVKAHLSRARLALHGLLTDDRGGEST